VPETLITSRRAALREEIVDEHGAVRNETVIADEVQLANEGMRLDPATAPDANPSLNFDKRPDKRLIANLAAIEIHRLDDGDVRAELDANDT
jgi:hypothetical protein